MEVVMKNSKIPKFSSFSYTCKNEKKRKYSIIHDPRPINLSPDMTLAIEFLLWYVPNINSIQSEKNILIEKKLYDDFTFSILMEEMKLKKEDVIFLDYIDDIIVEYYKTEICTNCQKLILTQGDEETKTSSMLRHIRNSIAHGLFNIIDDTFIGFDLRDLNPKDSSYDCTGIVKLYPTHLIKALSLLDKELTHEKLAELAFSRCGYNILDDDRKNRNLPYDFSMEKEGRRYAVEIKKFDIKGHIKHNQVKELFSHFTGESNYTNILIIDSAHLNLESKKALQKASIIIMDQSNIEKILLGNDILARIEKSRKKR